MIFRASVPAFVLAAVLSGPARAAPGQSLDVTTGLETCVDDNILNYSGAQLVDLDSGLYPYRFGVAQAGDFVFKPSIALLWQLDRGGERRRSLGLRAEGEMHGRSVVANSGELGLTWREGFRRGRLTLAYQRSPHDYLRRLYDQDLASLPVTERYRDVTLDLQRGSVAWRNPVPRASWVELGYRFERRKHPSAFRERDSGTHQGELRVGWERLPRDGRLALSAGARKRDARGQDGDEPPGAVPDEPDLSYHSSMAGVNGSLELGALNGLRFVGDVEYDLEHRQYDSRRPADDSHYGRKDLLQAVEVGLRLRAQGPWSARAFYRLQHSRAWYGGTAPQGLEIGGYQARQAGLALEWRRQVWSRNRAPVP